MGNNHQAVDFCAWKCQANASKRSDIF